jgi:hypothetical protein
MPLIRPAVVHDARTNQLDLFRCASSFSRLSNRYSTPPSGDANRSEPTGHAGAQASGSTVSTAADRRMTADDGETTVRAETASEVSLQHGRRGKPMGPPSPVKHCPIQSRNPVNRKLHRAHRCFLR